MSSPEEARLKRHFEQLRDEDQRSAPSFASMLSARPRVASRRIVIAAVLLLMAAIGTVVAIRARVSSGASGPEPVTLASWSSPTAFLLETPGKRFLRETPRFYAPPEKQDGPR